MRSVWTYGLLSFSVKAAWCLGCDSPSPQGCYKYGSSDSRDSDSGISRCCKSVHNIIFQKSCIFTNRPTFWISNTVDVRIPKRPTCRFIKTLVNNGDFNYQPLHWLKFSPDFSETTKSIHRGCSPTGEDLRVAAQKALGRQASPRCLAF